MDEPRLPKLIYNELHEMYAKNKPCAFNYVSYIKDILVGYCADHMFENNELLCMSQCKKLISDTYCNSFCDTLQNCSSLKYLKKENTSMARYLVTKNVCFKAIQLKFKMRFGVSGIGEDLQRQHRGQGKCHCGSHESLSHVLFFCDMYSQLRLYFYNTLYNLYGDVFLAILYVIPLSICIVF